MLPCHTPNSWLSRATPHPDGLQNSGVPQQNLRALGGVRAALLSAFSWKRNRPQQLGAGAFYELRTGAARIRCSENCPSLETERLEVSECKLEPNGSRGKPTCVTNPWPKRCSSAAEPSVPLQLCSQQVRTGSEPSCPALGATS